MKSALLIASAVILSACGGAPELPAEEQALVDMQTSLNERLGSTKTTMKNLKDSLELVQLELDKLRGNTEILPLVETTPVNRGHFEHYFEVQGNVEAEQDVVLYAEAGGNIKKIHVTEGAKVKSGQTLVSFDTEIITKNIAELEKSLELAEFVYEKQKSLWEQNIGSELQYVQAKNQKESLEQTLATLRAQRSKSIISAPFDGVIDDILPKAGEMVGPGMPVLRIVNQNNLSVTADVNESYLGDVEEGSLATLHFPALGEEYNIDSVTLNSWGRYINPNNRTFKVTTIIPSTEPVYLPNLLVEMRIRDFAKDSVLVIPTKYIHQNSSNEDYVYVLGKNKKNQMIAVRKVVSPRMAYKPKSRNAGETTMSMTYILDEAGDDKLKDTDILITEGFKGVQDGIAIAIKESK